MGLCQSEAGLGLAERVALCVLRRVLRGETRPCLALVCPFGVGCDVAAIQTLFAAIWEDEAVPSAFFNLNVWRGSITERRLLRALAAAQVENDHLLAQYLIRPAPDAAVRQRLTRAMEALAATLAVHGYWLPQPADLLPIPASVLRLARTQGHDLEMAQIVWPSHSQSNVTFFG